MILIDGIASAITNVSATWDFLRKNRVIAAATRTIFVLWLTSLAVILWRWHLLPPLVPLWYSRPWGADRLINPAWLFLLPAGILIWYASAVILATYVTREYLIFTQVIILTTLLGAFLSLVTIAKILFLVT